MLTTGLTPIHPLTLVPNFCVGTNVYLWNEQQEATVKFLSCDQVVTESACSQLLSNASQKVYIDDTSYASYESYLFEHLNTWMADPRIPTVLKTTIVAEAIRSRFAQALSQNTVRGLVESARECSELLCSTKDQIRRNGRNFHRALRHDCSMATHAVNTAFYVFLIADAQGYSVESTTEFCVGAMLHDIGKLGGFASESNAVGDTGTSEDWSDRKNQAHPTEGFKHLCREPGIAESQLLMCYQHHEQPDGKGFPVGLLGDEIHEASRICCVANRMDGLTSDRPHRRALTRTAALRILESEKRTHLDSEVVRCLISKIVHSMAN